MASISDAQKWFSSRDTGLSSEAIAWHMLSGDCDGSYPHDPDDLGRCLRLLEKFPEWKSRIDEMSAYGPVWAAYVSRWDEITRSMEDEVGIHWEKAKKAPRTYALMHDIARGANAA